MCLLWIISYTFMVLYSFENSFRNIISLCSHISMKPVNEQTLCQSSFFCVYLKKKKHEYGLCDLRGPTQWLKSHFWLNYQADKQQSDVETWSKFPTLFSSLYPVEKPSPQILHISSKERLWGSNCWVRSSCFLREEN